MSNRIKYWLEKKADKICAKLEKNILSNKSLKCKAVFGPVHSRRLGEVIGINNYKQKVCSYNCVYCPSGSTSCCSVCSNYCLSPYELRLSVRAKLEELKANNKRIEYIAFSGSGEPTLDSSLAKEILLLRQFGYKIAVFTNSSLLWNANIQENLMFADYVSVKIDTVNEETWFKLNRPHRKLDYSKILNGIKQFSGKFRGTLTTETMLIKDINDNAEEINELSKFLAELNCSATYFLTPVYPPVEPCATIPETGTLQQLSQIIKEEIKNSVLLCCPENEEFFSTDDFENEFLGLLSVHPIAETAVKQFARSENKLIQLDELIENCSIKEITQNGKKFYTIAEEQPTY